MYILGDTQLNTLVQRSAVVLMRTGIMTESPENSAKLRGNSRKLGTNRNYGKLSKWEWKMKNAKEILICACDVCLENASGPNRGNQITRKCGKALVVVRVAVDGVVMVDVCFLLLSN